VVLVVIQFCSRQRSNVGFKGKPLFPATESNRQGNPTEPEAAKFIFFAATNYFLIKFCAE
jgi:hypothetical protein